MAIQQNRNIFYRTSEDFITHFYGKKVRSIQRRFEAAQINVLFEDGTFIEVGEHEPIPDNPVFKRHPALFCMSCGEMRHSLGVFIDESGRCPTTLGLIWQSARKVYWHRYLKNKVNA